MPLLSRYVIFASIAALVLLPTYLLGMFPGNLQSLACRVYPSCYWAFSVVSPFFLFAVLIELAKHMFEKSVDGRRLMFTGTVTRGLLGLFIVSAYVVITRQGVPDYGFLGKGLVVASRIADLLVLVATPLLFALKRRRSVALETNLAVIAAAIGLFTLFDLVISFARQGKEAGPSDLALQGLGLAFVVAIFVALTKGPRVVSAAASA